MKPVLFTELSLGAQTAYAELRDQLITSDVADLRRLPGAFHRQLKRGRSYIYYGFRDIDGTGRMAYVGPEDARIVELMARRRAAGDEVTTERLRAQAHAAEALGCAATMTKHFRVINRLGQYGFFRAGAILVGTHAFLAMGNMLGLRWASGDRTQDVDFARAGRNISVALGADLRLSVHDALTSLEMALLPIAEFSGKTGAQYRNPKDPELRLDFVTSQVRGGGPVLVAKLGLALECLKFMEFSLDQPVQAMTLAREGARLVNIPSPARYAVHKLLVFGERPIAERVKAQKDLGQAAALIEYFLHSDQPGEVATAWQDALARGKGWQRRAIQGRKALLGRHPQLAARLLWT